MNVYHNLYAGFLAGTNLPEGDQKRILSDLEHASAKVCKEHRSDLVQKLVNKEVANGSDILEGYQVGRWTEGGKTKSVALWDVAKTKAEFDTLASQYNKANSRGFHIAAAVFGVAALALLIVASIFFPISFVVAGSCLGAAVIATLFAASFATQQGKEKSALYQKAVQKIAEQAVVQAQMIINNQGAAVLERAVLPYVEAKKGNTINKINLQAQIKGSLFEQVNNGDKSKEVELTRFKAIMCLVDAFTDGNNRDMPKLDFPSLKP